MRVRFAAWFCLCTATAGTALADDDAIVLRVGSATLREAELGRRLGRTPDYQLARYGKTVTEARKEFVDQVIVPELLLAEEARSRKLEERPALGDKIRDAMKSAMDRALREEVASKTPVTPADIKNYYESNRERFETPRRIRIWRILVADESSAKKLIGEAKGSDGPKKWSQLARDSSLDKATSLRNGDLGFVRPDGSTDAPRVKINLDIVAAAEKVADGAIVERPIREGDGFAVIWRRGSMAEVKRTLEQEQDSIRQLLERRRAEEARSALLTALKQAGLKERHPELLERIDTEVFGPPPKRTPATRDGGGARLPLLKRPPQPAVRSSR